MRAILAWCSALIGCATLAETGGGDVGLPNAHAGPFREIRQAELGNTRAAPYALRDDEEFPRDVSVIDADGDPATLDVWAYAALTRLGEGEMPDATAPPNAIVRYRALDGRSFARAFDVVLEPAEPWEGASLGSPSALRVASEVWLYYQAEGGIGLARSADGVSFERAGQVLTASSGAVPESPAVLTVDGGYHMFYAASGAIGEARSIDGITWQRVGDVVSSGEAPCAVLGISATGRLIEYLYYAVFDAAGERSIAMAARFGLDGAFVPSVAPVFGNDLDPTEPWVLRYPTFTLLFATQKAGSTAALDYPAVAVGVAPADSDLGPPNPP